MPVQRTRVRIVLLVASLLITTAGTGAIRFQEQSAQSIERRVTEFLTLFSSRDFAGFLPFFSEDATVFFPPSAAAPTGRVRGKAEIERTFREVFAKYPPRSPGSVTPIRPLDLLVDDFGDVAIVTFHLGSDAARQRRTLVLRRIAGDWKIVHLHGSVLSSASSSS